MRKLKIFSFIILLILICNISLANDGGNVAQNSNETNNNQIVYVNSNEIELNSEFYLILNLSKIDYTKFNVKIINSSQASVGTLPDGISEVSKTSNNISFNVDKAQVSLNKMAIVYTASQLGNVDFNITITSLDDEVATWKNELETINNEITELNTKISNLKSTLKEDNTVENNVVGNNIVEDNYATNENSEEEIEKLQKNLDEKNSQKSELEEKIKNYTQSTIQSTASVKVCEKIENNEKDSLISDKKMLGQDEKMDGMLDNMKKMMNQVEELEGNLKTANSTIDSLTNTVTYQGSQNNYLTSLSVDGVEFKSAFKKTTQTYFANVDSNVSNVVVNAVAEDSSAIVTVYGSKNLVDGKNKILITVTADDGSTRTYKIYITK